MFKLKNILLSFLLMITTIGCMSATPVTEIDDPDEVIIDNLVFTGMNFMSLSSYAETHKVKLRFHAYETDIDAIDFELSVCNPTAQANSHTSDTIVRDITTTEDSYADIEISTKNLTTKAILVSLVCYYDSKKISLFSKNVIRYDTDSMIIDEFTTYSFPKCSICIKNGQFESLNEYYDFSGISQTKLSDLYYGYLPFSLLRFKYKSEKYGSWEEFGYDDENYNILLEMEVPSILYSTESLMARAINQGGDPFVVYPLDIANLSNKTNEFLLLKDYYLEGSSNTLWIYPKNVTTRSSTIRDGIYFPFTYKDIFKDFEISIYFDRTSFVQHFLYVVDINIHFNETTYNDSSLFYSIEGEFIDNSDDYQIKDHVEL